MKLAAILLLGGLASSTAQTNALFDETFDTTNTPAGANALAGSGGAGLNNPVVTYVNGAGTAGSRALVMKADFTQASSGYVAYEYQNQMVSGNPSANLADYQLSFDLKVNNPGLRYIQCTLQSWQRINSSGAMTATPMGLIPLGTYTPGTFIHVAVGLTNKSVWPGANAFNPAGGTWQIQFQVNGGNGAAVNTNEQVTVDNLAVSMAFATSAQCTVNWTNVQQRIDGFGASSAFKGSTLSDAQADLFFTTNNNGIGLSLLRNRIIPGGTTDELGTMQKAQTRGALVWSTPWSPPAAFKDNNSVDGGNFVAANYQAYASQLAGYAAAMKSAGVNLCALSLQNEPELSEAGYESCVWTAQEFHDFIPYVYQALVASNVPAIKIMLAEENCWAWDLTITTMNDPNTAAMTGVLAAHGYCDEIAAMPNPDGKPVWETEDATYSDTYDGSITNALYWASQIHAFLTVAQVNAWHYWWLVPASTDNEGLTDSSGNPAKRLFALGNYSRFIRPGYYRVGVTNNNPAVLISAYKDTNSANFAIVAVNLGSAAVTQTFNFTGLTASVATPWITSATMSLSNQPVVTVYGSTFTNTLPAMSVVTFTGGPAATPPPVLGASEQGANLVLFWPTNAAGYALQYATNLATTNWLPVSPLPVVSGTNNVVTNGTPNANGYYRLRHP